MPTTTKSSFDQQINKQFFCEMTEREYFPRADEYYVRNINQ